MSLTPDFSAALVRHRLIDAIDRADITGQKTFSRLSPEEQAAIDVLDMPRSRRAAHTDCRLYARQPASRTGGMDR
jgi:hypothetical protein